MNLFGLLDLIDWMREQRLQAKTDHDAQVSCAEFSGPESLEKELTSERDFSKQSDHR
jgi:hypothetical protein